MLARRLAAQGLLERADGDPVAVVRRLLAVQAQDPRGMRLAVRARARPLDAADVDAELTERRTLVVTWLLRGTLHLVRREDVGWLHALCAPTVATANAHRLAQEGVSPDDADRAVAAIEGALAEHGPLGRTALREHVARAGVRAEGQALPHLLLLAARRGLVVRGPVVEGEHRYVLWRDWLGPPAPVDRDGALAELARRYLEGHGPAADRDLARWAGLALRDARAGLRAIGAELEARGDGLVDLAGRDDTDALPAPVLLGAFDPLLLGWASRAAVVPEEATGTVAAGGILRAVALVRGRAAATWALRRRVELTPFAPLDAAEEEALRADGEDVVRFLGGGAGARGG